MPRDARAGSAPASISTSSSSTAGRPTRRSRSRARTGPGSTRCRPTTSTTRRPSTSGIERVAGDLVLILSAHAIPVDDEWVARWSRRSRIRAWPASRAARCRGRARRGARSSAWRRVRRRARVYDAAADEILFSNAASCIRRSAGRASRSRCPRPRTSSGRRARVRRAGRSPTRPPRPSITRTTRPRAIRRSG